MILLYLLLLPFALADIVYYRPHDPHRGVKIFGFVMASLCGAALFAWAGWILLRRRRRIQIMRAQVVVVPTQQVPMYQHTDQPPMYQPPPPPPPPPHAVPADSMRV